MVDNSEMDTSVSQVPKLKQNSKDTDGFAKPSRRLTRKVKKTQETSRVETFNHYTSLSDAESESSNAPEMKRKRKLNDPMLNNNTQPSTSATLQNKTSLKRDGKLTKPIRIPATSYEEIQNVLSTLKLKTRPTVTKVFGKAYRILSSSTEDKNKIIEKLNEKSIDNFTHGEAVDRQKIFVIKRHHAIKTEDLLKILKDQGIPAVSVAQIGKSSDDPTFSVSFEKNSITLAELTTQHKDIGGLRILWEKFNPKKKRYVQCKRCQRWGHGATNCNMTRRCVKCKETHEAGQCSRKSPTDEGEPHCINCGKDGHPANSSSCEIFKKHVAAIERKKKIVQRPREFISTPAPWSRQNNNEHNFPALPAHSVNQSTNHTPKYHEEVSREYRPFLTQPRNAQAQKENSGLFFGMKDEFMEIPGMVETMKLYRQIIAKLKESSDPLNQIKVLFQYGIIPNPFQLCY